MVYRVDISVYVHVEYYCPFCFKNTLFFTNRILLMYYVRGEKIEGKRKVHKGNERMSSFSAE